MSTSIISGDDIRFLVQQSPAQLTTIMGQMTTLVQGITELQNDTNSRVEAMEKQGWFKRMWSTVSGKNKASKAEIQKNQDKVVSYVSQAVSQCYQMNCIDQQAICSLGNRMNQIYAQVNEAYNEQLQMKAQIAEIQQIQQETLLALGKFVTALNEKIESVDNFHMLIEEIRLGRFSDESKLYSLCCVLSQLDKRTLEDERKLDILRGELTKRGIISDEGISVGSYLEDILSLADDKVGTVYLELCNIRESFPADLFAEMIESYHFLPKIEKMSKKKETIIQRVLDSYELDDSAEFSYIDITDSFIENKQECIVSISDISQIEENAAQATDMPSDEEIGKIVNELAENEEYDKLFAYLSPLAECGSANAQLRLGHCYSGGLGVEENEELAIKWFTKAAEQGYANAQFYLGWRYERGEGIPQNWSKAVEWYTKAAEQGHAYAQLNLGWCYKNGEGVPQNWNKAVEWYTKAAEQGQATAQYNLAFCYYEGEGVPQNKSKAIEWFKKAAEQGQENAQKILNDLGIKWQRY